MATQPLPGDSSPVTTLGAPQTPAQAVFAVLGYDGAGDLIDALLDAMDAADGDPDISANGDEDDFDPDDDDRGNDLEDGDVDCCGAGDDDVPGYSLCAPGDGGAGDPVDAEDDDPDHEHDGREEDHDAEGCNHLMAGGGSVTP